MSKFMYCLVQLLSWEVDTRKYKQFLKCEECHLKDKCKKYKAEIEPQESEDKESAHEEDN